MKSIMQQKDGRCYLCMLLNQNYREWPSLEEHHVIFGSRHKLSEKYGLKVYLCAAHHRTSAEAVHQNATIANLLKDKAQRSFEKTFPDLDFMAIFGKNYKIDSEEKTEKENNNGFISLEEKGS